MAQNDDVQKLIVSLQALTQTVKKLTDSLVGKLEGRAPSAPGGGAGGAAAGGAAGLGKLTAALGGTTLALGSLAAVATLTAGALNPGALETLNIAFRDLLATVGVAFEPALRVFTRGIEQIANAILPLFLALRPVLTQLTEIFLRALVPVVRLVATLLTALVPLLTPVLALAGGFADIILTLSVLFQTLVETIAQAIAAFVGTSLADASKEATKALQYLAQQLILFVATIAAKIGAMGFVAKLIDNFKTAMKPPVGGAKAGGPVTTTTLDAIVKKMAESAGKAGGFAGPSPEEEAKAREEERQKMLQETLAGLLEIQKKGETDTTLPDILAAAKACAEFLLAVKDATAKFIRWLGPIFEAPLGSMGDAKQAAGQSFEGAAAGRKTRESSGNILGQLGGEFGEEMGRNWASIKKFFGG
jgi:hypothetical protein